MIRASQVALEVKNLPANAGDVRDFGSTPGLGRSPGGGHSNSFQYSCLENPMDRGAWKAEVHGVSKELDTTEGTKQQPPGVSPSFLNNDTLVIAIHYQSQEDDIGTALTQIDCKLFLIGSCFLCRFSRHCHPLLSESLNGVVVRRACSGTHNSTEFLRQVIFST